jgi:hypothetical protein
MLVKQDRVLLESSHDLPGENLQEESGSISTRIDLTKPGNSCITQFLLLLD